MSLSEGHAQTADPWQHFPFRVTNQNDKPAITVEVQGRDKSFSPEEVSAMVLGKMKEIAESYLGKKVVNAGED